MVHLMVDLMLHYKVHLIVYLMLDLNEHLKFSSKAIADAR